MGRKTIPVKTQKELYAKSGNMCAFPNCSIRFYDEDSNNVSNICHIEAYNKGSRHNSSLSEDECNDIENLMLLCANHHTIIDADEEKYTVDVLKKMKKGHEEYIKKQIDYKEVEYKEYEFNFIDDLVDNLFDCSKSEINNVLKNIERLNTEYKEVLFFILTESEDNGLLDLKYIKATTKVENLSEIVGVLEKKGYIFEFEYINCNGLIEMYDGSLYSVENDYDFKIANGKWQLESNGNILKEIFSILNESTRDFYEFLVNNNYEALENTLKSYNLTK
ncbi:MAG: HNH endonuclease signature motif containing protein [Sarcina sp.]